MGGPQADNLLDSMQMDNFNLDFEIDDAEIERELNKRNPIYEDSDEDLLES